MEDAGAPSLAIERVADHHFRIGGREVVLAAGTYDPADAASIIAAAHAVFAEADAPKAPPAAVKPSITVESLTAALIRKGVLSPEDLA